MIPRVGTKTGTNHSTHQWSRAPIARGVPTLLHKTGFSRILVTVDFSTATSTVMDMALALVRRGNGALWLMQVIERTPLLSGRDGVLLAKSDEEVADSALRSLQRLSSQWSAFGVSVGSLVRIGRASDEICMFAASSEVDLILMYRGHDFLDRMRTESTMHRVLRKAPCPVLLLPVGAMASDRQYDRAECERLT